MKNFFQTREHYKEIVTEGCDFCSEFPKIQFLKEFENFNWILAKSPYWSFKVPTKKGLKRIATHTMLVPKRHITKFSDLTKDEAWEFVKLYDQIKNVYDRLPTRVSAEEPTAQFVTIFRQYANPRQVTSEHFHIHFSPGGMTLLGPSLHNDAHLIESRDNILDLMYSKKILDLTS